MAIHSKRMYHNHTIYIYTHTQTDLVNEDTGVDNGVAVGRGHGQSLIRCREEGGHGVGVVQIQWH
jgi:hypothetical protein